MWGCGRGVWGFGVWGCRSMGWGVRGCRTVGVGGEGRVSNPAHWVLVLPGPLLRAAFRDTLRAPCDWRRSRSAARARPSQVPRPGVRPPRRGHRGELRADRTLPNSDPTSCLRRKEGGPKASGAPQGPARAPTPTASWSRGPESGPPPVLGRHRRALPLLPWGTEKTSQTVFSASWSVAYSLKKRCKLQMQR